MENDLVIYSEQDLKELRDFIDYLLVSGRKDGNGGLSKGTVKDLSLIHI